MVELQQEVYEISNFFALGFPFPFEKFNFDSNILFKRINAEKCKAFIAVERNKKKEAEQTIFDIASIYSLITENSCKINHDGGITLKSLEELGGSYIHMEISLGQKYSKNEIKKFSNIHSENWKRTKIIWNNLINTLSQDNKRFLRLALHYYYRSGLPFKRNSLNVIIQPNKYDDIFLDAVMGLETLFNDGPPDITYKLSIRGVLLLSCIERDKETKLRDLHKEIQRLYRKRNKIIHGVEREEVKSGDFDKIREILRGCLFSYLALGIDRDKSEILNLIDNALVVPESLKELKSSIKRGFNNLGIPEVKLK